MFEASARVAEADTAVECFQAIGGHAVAAVADLYQQTSRPALRGR